MDTSQNAFANRPARRNWIWYVLVILNIEKIIQHIFVTYAFWLDIGGLRSTVAVPPGPVDGCRRDSGHFLHGQFVGHADEQEMGYTPFCSELAIFDMIGEFISPREDSTSVYRCPLLWPS